MNGEKWNERKLIKIKGKSQNLPVIKKFWHVI